MKLDVLDSFRLQRRLAPVTGASRGFGEVIAGAALTVGGGWSVH